MIQEEVSVAQMLGGSKKKKKKSSPKRNWDVFATDTMKSSILLIHIPWPFKISLNPVSKEKKKKLFPLSHHSSFLMQTPKSPKSNKAEQERAPHERGKEENLW